jgi:hypothetical protein
LEPIHDNTDDDGNDDDGEAMDEEGGCDGVHAMQQGTAAAGARPSDKKVTPGAGPHDEELAPGAYSLGTDTELMCYGTPSDSAPPAAAAPNGAAGGRVIGGGEAEEAPPEPASMSVTGSFSMGKAGHNAAPANARDIGEGAIVAPVLPARVPRGES